MHTPNRIHLSCLTSITLVVGCWSTTTNAQSNYENPEWRVVNPSTTGMPADEVRFGARAPDGRFWVGGRHYFWSEGGIGVLDLATDTWEVHTNVPNSGLIEFPSAFANDIEFAPDGTVWVATQDGLTHFENGEWTTFTSANSPLPYNDVRSIDMDSHGNVWMVVRKGVSFINSRVFKFDGTNWESWGVGAGIPWQLPWEYLDGLTIDANDHVWVTNENQPGIAEFDGTTWTIHDPGIGGGMHAPFADSAGNIWMISGSIGYKVYRFDGTIWTPFSSSNTPFVTTTITSFGEDDTGRIYIGNWAGQIIRQVVSGSDTFKQIAQIPGPAYSLMPQDNGELWCTTFGGTIYYGTLFHIDQSGTIFKEYSTWNTGMPDYFIDQLKTDREGNMWVATGEGGISRFNGTYWRNWGNHNAGSEPYPWAGNEPMGGFFIDSLGRGWMGGNGIGLWDQLSGQFLNFWNWQNTPAMGVTNVSSFAEDVNGTIFAMDEYGYVLQYTGTTWEFAQAAPYYVSQAPSLATDAAGNVFVPYPYNIMKWDGAVWSEVQQPNPEFLFDLQGITSLEFAPDDTMWIGTNNGLVRARNGVWTVFDQNNSPLPAKQVRGLDIRDDGLIGLSCHEFLSTTPFPTGVCIIDGEPDDPNNWYTFGYGTHPIPHYQLGDVEFDKDGNLWVVAVSEGCAVAMFGDQLCFADCDSNGVLNIFDYICFGNAYATQDPNADCDGNTLFNIFDYICFGNAYAAGCP